MKWLRERPERWEELDSVDWKGRFKDGLNLDDEDMSGESENEVEGGKRSGKTKSGDKKTKPQTGKKGKLFEDEEDEEEEDDDEEEEEDVVAPTTGQSVKATTVVR